MSVPSAPILSPEVKDRSIILSWNVKQEGKSPIEYYNLNAMSFIKSLSSSTTKYEVPDLQPETEYRYSIQACNRVYFCTCFDVLSDNWVSLLSNGIQSPNWDL